MVAIIPNTFGLKVYANDVIEIGSPDALLKLWKSCHPNYPFMVIGQGSNTLFLSDFDGTVVVNRIKGITISSSPSHWLLKVGAGEIWHELVEYTVNSNMGGLENLALIPGCVGSAPIQNIGAYGVECKDVIDYVQLLELATGKILTIKEGNYGYRDSIFKHDYLIGYVVIYVGIRLPKKWIPNLEYGDLIKMDKSTATPKTVFDSVCHIRQTKLPDPAIVGNGGSFFKNPIIDKLYAEKLCKHFPHMPIYVQADGTVKLAAGWLIDQCGLKGYQIGGAAVHDKQALVLINKNQATPRDILELAVDIFHKVKDKFGVALSPEIRFIGNTGEISNADPMNWLSL